MTQDELNKLAEQYGDNNPAIVLARIHVDDGRDINIDQVKRIASYCNEPVTILPSRLGPPAVKPHIIGYAHLWKRLFK